MNDTQLRKAIEKKLNKSQSTVYRWAYDIRDRLDIPLKEAFYVLAFSAGISLSKVIRPEEIDRVRNLHGYLSPDVVPVIPRESGNSNKNPGEKVQKQVILNISEIEKITDPLLSEAKTRDAVEMAKVYIRIFILENSFRETIDLVMTKRYGKNWWDSKVKNTLKDTYNDRKRKEEKNPWFGQKRGARPIDYLDLSELPNIVQNNIKDFIPDIFPNLHWLQEKIDELYFSRCVICHMNSLVKYNVDDVKSIFRKWENQIKEKNGLIKL